MQTTTTDPRLTENGVLFTVRVDSQNRECVILKEALEKLSALKSIDAADADTMEVFHAFEATINGVARRLISARVPGIPLVMNANTFHAPCDVLNDMPS